MQAIVLAGGRGTRLRSVVSHVPKPMAPVDGRPFLEHLLDYWISQGVTRVVISVGYMRDLIKDHFGPSYRNCAIKFADEEIALGTGGAVLNCLQQLEPKEPTLVLNGDTFFAVQLNELKQFHELRGAAITLSLFESSETSRYSGVRLGTDGEILDIGSETKADSLCYVNGGVFYFSSKILKKLKTLPIQVCNLESELISGLIASGERVSGYVSRARFIDIGTPGDYLRAPSILGD